MSTSAMFTNCTCAVIKPHAIQAGLAGQIIDTILEEGFEISAGVARAEIKSLEKNLEVGIWPITRKHDLIRYT